jgi:hypothetical protein
MWIVVFCGRAISGGTKMATTTDEGAIGERIVAQWLFSKKYSVKVNTNLPGSTDIQATSNKVNLLVQVKTAVFPNVPASLSAEEKGSIKSRAARLSYEAWEAKVQLDADLDLVGNIIWQKLG